MFQSRDLGWLSTVTEVNRTWWNFAPLAHGEVKLFMDCGNTLNLSAFIKVVSWLASAKQSAADLSMKHWESLHLQKWKGHMKYEINVKMRNGKMIRKNGPADTKTFGEKMFWEELFLLLSRRNSARHQPSKGGWCLTTNFLWRPSSVYIFGAETEKWPQWLSDISVTSVGFLLVSSFFLLNLHFHRIAPLGMCESNILRFWREP